jgi:hypothetical protein
MRWLFVLGFSAGVMFIYTFIYIFLSRRIKRRWSYRIKRIKRLESEISYWDQWLLERSGKPRNEKIRLYLQRAGFGSTEYYLWFKKLEWSWPIAAAGFISMIETIRFTLEGGSIWGFHWKVFMSLVISGWALLHVILRWKARDRVIRIGIEVVRFSDRLLMSLSTKTSLFYSIKRAGRTTVILKPYIDLLLIEWSQENPKKAIRKFMKRVATDEMVPLTNAMLVITDHPGKAEYLMEQQMKNVETIRDFVVKQRIRAKPVYLILLVTIPFTAGMVALIAPWYSETVRQLQAVF